MKRNMYLGVIATLLTMPTFASTQEFEVVDYIDLETGEIFHSNPPQNDGKVSCDTLDVSTPSVPQVPFEELDSLTMSSLDDRYVVVYKDGKCGIYDLLKEENVTPIKYSFLCFSSRKEIEGEYYTYFAWEEEDTVGFIGIAEENNHFMAMAMPKDEEEDEMP